ncbi:MAG: hypothetical protein AAGI68_00020 [Planctomycetota bacterium]
MPAISQTPFRLVLARPVLTPAGDHTTLVHLSWFFADDTPSPGLIQVYLDYKRYATLPPQPNHTWLSLDRSQPHTIELLAVSRDQADQDLQSQLKTWSPPYTLQPRLDLERDLDAPISATVSVSKDQGQTLAASLVWPNHTPRGGFGSLFGVSAFGIDNAASPGLGLAPLAQGPLDLDNTSLNPELTTLQAGSHAVQIAYSHRPGELTQAQVLIDPPLHTTPSN